MSENRLAIMEITAAIYLVGGVLAESSFMSIVLNIAAGINYTMLLIAWRWR